MSQNFYPNGSVWSATSTWPKAITCAVDYFSLFGIFYPKDPLPQTVSSETLATTLPAAAGPQPPVSPTTPITSTPALNPQPLEALSNGSSTAPEILIMDIALMSAIRLFVILFINTRRSRGK